MDNWREVDTRIEDDFRNILSVLLNGEQWPIKFCMDLLYVAHLWDDMIDKDKDRTEDEVNAGFRKAMVDIPINPFYRQFSVDLAPLMLSAIHQYESANVLEREEGSGKRLYAYFLRNALLNVIAYSVFIVTGSMDAVMSFHSYCSETFARKFVEFMKEYENA